MMRETGRQRVDLANSASFLNCCSASFETKLDRLVADLAELKGTRKASSDRRMMITTAIVVVASGVVGGVFAALRYTGQEANQV